MTSPYLKREDIMNYGKERKSCPDLDRVVVGLCPLRLRLGGPNATPLLFFHLHLSHRPYLYRHPHILCHRPPPHLVPRPSHYAHRRFFLSSRLPCVATWYVGRASCSPHGCHRAPHSLVRPPSSAVPPFPAPRRRRGISTPPPTSTAVGGRVARCLRPRPLSLAKPRRNVRRQLRSPPHAVAGAPMTARTGCRCIPKAVPRGERDQACRRHAPRKCTRR